MAVSVTLGRCVYWLRSYQSRRIWSAGSEGSSLLYASLTLSAAVTVMKLRYPKISPLCSLDQRSDA
jgi:hypothetical protein